MLMISSTIIRIDLSNKKVKCENIPATLLCKFMGGKGLAAHYLYHENPPGCDPLSPDNLLAIMNGSLTGAPATNCVNFSVCAKSPLTGTWNDSHCNGWWGTALCRVYGYYHQWTSRLSGIHQQAQSHNPVMQ
jgi:aldehyde:ferredoxin oxidoreductase